MLSTTALFVACTLAASSPQTEEPLWETSLEQAVERASAENKPILHLQLFGRLDEELC